jgi:mannosyltransferase OCH1-like enzyme
VNRAEQLERDLAATKSRLQDTLDVLDHEARRLERLRQSHDALDDRTRDGGLQAAAVSRDEILVPRVFHRVWLGDESMPEEFVAYGETWVEHHPGWEMRFWTEDNLPELERTEVLDPARVGAERVDILRYELLWRFGGVYVDTDFECLRSIEPLLGGLTFFTAWHNPPRDRVNNAFIGCVPGHPIVERAMREARPGTPGEYSKPATGPHLFDAVVRDYPEATRFKSSLFYPRTARERAHAYAVHHEARSWSSMDPVERLERNLEATRSRLDDKSALLDATRLELARLEGTRWSRARAVALSVVKPLHARLRRDRQ